ncbi:MAG: hypothetical protein ABIZ91_04950 [Gemmatimonadaceae bacterium]
MHSRSALRRVALLLGIVLLPAIAAAHVGTLDAFFAGMAGPYRIQVTIRPPGIVPGVAQVTVRVRDASVTRVTVQAAQWNVGTRGAPAPDVATRLATDSSLFSAELWLMTRGSYAVNVAVEGFMGHGQATIPVSNVATRKLEMPAALGWTLGGLTLFLSLGFVSLIRAAVGESVVAPGETPPGTRRARGRRAMVVAVAALAAALSAGRAWWSQVDRAYTRQLYAPLQARVGVVQGDSGAVLRLSIAESSFVQRGSTPIIPDHGKLMHLFLIGTSAPHALAHLHPAALDSATFESVIPALPPGAYHYFADVVHESGFAETMRGSVEISQASAPNVPSDGDDAWYAGEVERGTRHALPSGASVEWVRTGQWRANEDVLLRFIVRDSSGAIAALTPYMGMSAHAMVARDDGSVFAHLHGNGSFSMAAQAALAAINRGDTVPSRRADVPRPRLAVAGETPAHALHLTSTGELEFPFAFPREGNYRVWVQFRRGGQVETAAFSTRVR